MNQSAVPQFPQQDSPAPSQPTPCLRRTLKTDIYTMKTKSYNT